MHAIRVVPAVLAVSLAGCGEVDLGGSGSLFTLGPPQTRLPSGTVRFEPRSLSLRVGETAPVALRLDPRLQQTGIRWWNSAPPVVTVADFECDPPSSCGLARFEPAERAVLQLQECRVLHMRVTATAVGQDSVVAWANTCPPTVFFCGDDAGDSLLVEVRP